MEKVIVIGSDHGGFDMKERLKPFLQKMGHHVTDFGCYSKESVDYPDIALLVSQAVAAKDFDCGILLDGFGGGVCVAANKVKGVRAVNAYDVQAARFAAAHDDANVLCLGGMTMGELTLQEVLKVYLTTPYEGGRHQRRIDKIMAIEERCGLK